MATPDDIIVVGITGGIASGKSLVSETLSKCDGVTKVVDADVLGHRSYLPGTATLDALVHRFGREILAQDGTVSRPALGRLVFGDKAALEALNKIVWPAIRELFIREMRSVPAGSIVVLEAAILIEAGWTDLVDEVWVVVVSPEVARERLVRRNPSLSMADAEARIRSQLSNERRTERAHVVFVNDGTVELARARAREAFEGLRRRHTPMRPERVLIVDHVTNSVVDIRKRAVMRGFNLPHRATYVVCIHEPSLPRQVLYVQRRAACKEYCPSMLDPAPGGVVAADDDSYETNARREMEEEMGMTDLSFSFVRDFWFADEHTRVWGRILECRSSRAPGSLRLQVEEVESVSLLAAEEISRRSSEITPDGFEAFKIWARSRGMPLPGL